MRFILSLFMIFLLVSSELTIAAQTDTVQASWESQQIRFRYQAFTTFYTCDSLEDKLEDLLHAIGAREDARVEVKCFGSFNQTQRYADVLLAFAIPVYADVGPDSGASEEVFSASMQEIIINRRRPRDLEPGDCELVDDFRRQVVDKLGIQVLNNNVRCYPGRVSAFPPTMKLRLLQPIATEEEK